MICSEDPLHLYAIRNLIRKNLDFPIYAFSPGNPIAYDADFRGLLILAIDGSESEMQTWVAQFRTTLPGARLLAVLSHRLATAAAILLEAGVHSVWTSRSSIDDLIHATEATLAGKAWVEPGLSERTALPRVSSLIYGSFGFQGQTHARVRATPVLSRREIQIIELVQVGRSNQEIAESLALSVNTVKSHVSRIMQRLRVGNRTEAVVKAMHMGFIAPPNGAPIGGATFATWSP